MLSTATFPAAAAAIKYVGVNLAGAEFGQNSLPGALCIPNSHSGKCCQRGNYSGKK